MRTKLTPKVVFILLSVMFLLNSCGILQPSSVTEGIYYPGTAQLTNGTDVTGNFEIPRADADKVYYYLQGEGRESAKTISAENVKTLVLSNSSSPDKKVKFIYYPIKDSVKRWLYFFSEGNYVKAFIGAEEYKIDTNGEVVLIGTVQRISHGPGRMSTDIQPSFPIYLQKRDEPNLQLAGFKGGISFEGSTLRKGLTSVLSDDAALCDYIMDKKLEFKDLENIVSLYNPKRGDAPLSIDGFEVKKEKKFITSYLDKEMIFNLEIGKPLGDRYGLGLGLGLRSSFYRFISYGGELGVTKQKNIDDEKLMDNHPMNEVNQYGGWNKVPITQDDLSNDLMFRFNTFLGLQLPMDMGRFYLVPAAHISLGGVIGLKYAAINYGPMINMDLGFPLKNRSIFFIGGGYRYSTPLVSDEDKELGTYANFSSYEPFTTVFVRVGYKF